MRPTLALAADPGATLVLPIRQRTGTAGRRHLAPARAAPDTPKAEGRVPRVARMLALAHHWRGLIRAGVARDQADLARLVGVSRARVTQVMDLLYLAADIQEEVLFLERTLAERDPVRHRELRQIAGEPLWDKQRVAWESLRSP